jgi:hypothetical protein
MASGSIRARILWVFLPLGMFAGLYVKVVTAYSRSNAAGSEMLAIALTTVGVGCLVVVAATAGFSISERRREISLRGRFPAASVMAGLRSSQLLAELQTLRPEFRNLQPGDGLGTYFTVLLDSRGLGLWSRSGERLHEVVHVDRAYILSVGLSDELNSRGLRISISEPFTTATLDIQLCRPTVVGIVRGNRTFAELAVVDANSALN